MTDDDFNNYSLPGFSVTIYNMNTNTNISPKTIKYTNIHISTNQRLIIHKLSLSLSMLVFREHLKALTEVEDCKPSSKEFHRETAL